MYTETDIERRKSLHINAMRLLKNIFKSDSLSDNIEIRTISAASFYIYNSELWYLTMTHAKSIDAFQGRQVRYVLNNYWPKKISNEKFYKRSRVEPWSIKILRRRLMWLGHLLGLPTETTARIALIEAVKKVKKPRGKPKTTWLSTVKKDPIDGEILTIKQTENLEENLVEKVDDRGQWQSIVASAISSIRRRRLL